MHEKEIVENYTNSFSSYRIFDFVVFPVCVQTGCFKKNYALILKINSTYSNMTDN